VGLVDGNVSNDKQYGGAMVEQTELDMVEGIAHIGQYVSVPTNKGHGEYRVGSEVVSFNQPQQEHGKKRNHSSRKHQGKDLESAIRLDRKRSRAPTWSSHETSILLECIVEKDGFHKGNVANWDLIS
jgi:hypothetical protein